jgi:hypothetical protein
MSLSWVGPAQGMTLLWAIGLRVSPAARSRSWPSQGYGCSIASTSHHQPTTCYLIYVCDMTLIWSGLVWCDVMWCMVWCACRRVLLRRPKLLVLDEFDSSLDPHSQRRIHDYINRQFAAHTRIVIAHRYVLPLALPPPPTTVPHPSDEGGGADQKRCGMQIEWWCFTEVVWWSAAHQRRSWRRTATSLRSSPPPGAAYWRE